MGIGSAYPQGSVTRGTFRACVAMLGLQGLVVGSAFAQFAPVTDTVAVVAGYDHSCLIDSAGGVHCWGVNGDGQLGDGSTQQRSTPVPVLGLESGVTQLALGFSHSCALLEDGSVRCWGQDIYGQLGDGDSNDNGNSNVPIAITSLGTSVTAISAGFRHSCAILSDGELRCWGSNLHGQLGDGSQTDRFAPTPVSSLGSGVIAVAAGHSHSCAIAAGGAARCWGDNQSGALGNDSVVNSLVPVQVSGFSTGVTAIAAGDRWSCALLAGGVSCWGVGGALGSGVREGSLVPVDTVGAESGIVALRANFSSTCALSSAGALKCWGLNGEGQIGDGTLTNRIVATPVSGLDSGVTGFAVGSYHACAIVDGGGLKCWGKNGQAQLGDTTTTSQLNPAAASGLGSGNRALATGHAFSCAVTASRGVSCWGQRRTEDPDEEGGQIAGQRVPGAVDGLAGIVAVDAGEQHACALDQGGGVHCWGLGNDGQLGDGANQHRLQPVQPLGLSSGVAAIALGGAHSCALMQDGSVRCWGLGAYGALGNGSTDSRNEPTPVPGLQAVAIVAGWRYACALLASGQAMCWGDNEGEGFTGGMLGDGTRTSRLTPTAVVAPGVVFTALAAGGNHTCGITSGGGLKCWGDNAQGQLGIGSQEDQLLPVDVAGLDSGVRAVTVGGLHPFLDEHTCAIDSEGGVRCWGANRRGQLSDGTTLPRSLPSMTGLTSSTVAVSAGGDHTCALSEGGAVTCWGWDQFGQVGSGGRDPSIPGDVLAQTRERTRAASDASQASGRAASDASGRYVVFESAADELVGGDGNGSVDIFRRDTLTGAVERVSLDDAGSEIGGASMEPAVSANGGFVVFVASDAGVGKVWNESKSTQQSRQKGGGFGIYLRNLLTGTTQRIGTGLPGGSGSTPQIAATGTAVVFTGLPTADQGDPSKPAVFHMPLDRGGDLLTPSRQVAECVTCKVIAGGTDTTQNADGDSRNAVLSADGGFVAFETTSKNILDDTPTPCPAPSSEIMLRDLLTGSSRRISPPPGATNCGATGAHQPSIDFTALRVAFTTDAPLDGSDANGVPDVYVADVGGPTIRVSKDPLSLADANGASGEPILSGDGRVVVFRSSARNLEGARPDNNELDDIVAARLDRREVQRVSRNARGDQGNGSSQRPAVNYNGTLVAFESSADNLLLDANDGRTLDVNGVNDVFQVRNPLLTRLVFRAGYE